MATSSTRKAGKGGARLDLGFRANGTQAVARYRPTLLQFGADMIKAECLAQNGLKEKPCGESIPIHSGWSLKRANGQMLLGVAETHALRFGRVFGFVGEIEYLQDDPDIPIAPKSPAMVQDVVKLWWRYDHTYEEALDSYAYVRMNAFASTAAFGGDSVWLSVGDPITGVIEANRSTYATAQLSGWPRTAAAEWKMPSPRSFFDESSDVNGNAIAAFPALSKDNSQHFHAPNLPYARLYGYPDPKCFDPCAAKPAASAANGVSSSTAKPRSADGGDRGRSATLWNSPGRRLRERYYTRSAAKKAATLAAQSAAQNPVRTKAPPAWFVPILSSLGISLVDWVS